jgi:hypothetical protein
MKHITLIVTDSSPLITLALADALDVLLLPKVSVIVPDMVRYEVVHDAAKPGATAVLEWIRAHEPEEVVVASTLEYEEFELLLRDKPGLKPRGRGERAAGEVLEKQLADGDDAAILLFEDSDLRKSNFLTRVPDNVLVMSTSEYLDGLEKKRLIPSADAILKRAVAVRPQHIFDRLVTATEGAESIKDDWPNRLKPRAASR